MKSDLLFIIHLILILYSFVSIWSVVYCEKLYSVHNNFSCLFLIKDFKLTFRYIICYSLSFSYFHIVIIIIKICEILFKLVLENQIAILI